jgi:hypothetical protein
MSFNWHAFLQTLLVGLQSANALSVIVPVKYSGLVTIMLSAAQAGLGFVAYSTTPGPPPAGPPHVIAGRQP